MQAAVCGIDTRTPMGKAMAHMGRRVRRARNGATGALAKRTTAMRSRHGQRILGEFTPRHSS
jgi:hypothetical protein